MDIFPYKPIANELKSNQSLTKELTEKKLISAFKEQINHFPEEIFSTISRLTLLRHLDSKWMDQLHNMDALREGIGLRAYGQRDPLIEYKVEAFQMFKEMLFGVYSETIKVLNRIESIETTAPESVTGQSPKNNPLLKKRRKNNKSFGRNDKITIEKNGETQEMKWKKAKELVENDGWAIIEKIMQELIQQIKKTKSRFYLLGDYL